MNFRERWHMPLLTLATAAALITHADHAGLTHQQPDGNRLVTGQGRIDPRPLSNVPMTGVSAWGAVLAEAFLNTLQPSLPPNDVRLLIGPGSSPESVELAIQSSVEGHYSIDVSSNLSRWISLGSVTIGDSATPVRLPLSALSGASSRFFRAVKVEDRLVADVRAVRVTGTPGRYTFAVEVESPELGCEQFADWWEVLSEDGELLYRRVLLHSHVNEQPFTRSGGPVPIEANAVVWVRAHMEPGGYGGVAYHGSVRDGFMAIDLHPGFAADTVTKAPLPQNCAF